MALSQTSVMKLYNTVMDDVISGVRESFLDEGVDEQVLQELKSIWEKKLSESKAVELNPDPPEPTPPVINSHKSSSKSSKKNSNASTSNANTNVQVTHQIIQEARSSPPAILPDIELPAQLSSATSQVQQISHQLQQNSARQSIQSPPQAQQQQIRLQQQQMQALSQQIQQNQAIPQQESTQAPDRQVSIQIKLPAHQNLPERLINVLVPTIAIQGNQLHSVFTGPIITAAIALPIPFATSLLQQHVNLTYSGTPGFIPGPVNHPVALVPQGGNNVQPSQQLIQAVSQQNHIAQLDGAAGETSDDDDEEEEEENDDEEDIDEDKEDDDNDTGAREEEPLNSEDDVTDDDPIDLFDTDNVVVCQYDKITRSRNKWKFYLKDGIMNLNGKDFVFQKANGDAEW